MKKYIYYIIIILSLTAIGTVIYLFRLKLASPKIYDTSQLTTITIGGSKYKTTGAIPVQDKARQDSFDQFLKLADLGDIATSQFTLTTSQYGDIFITIKPPYDKSKQAALDWLKNNGFDKLDQSKISFTESK